MIPHCTTQAPGRRECGKRTLCRTGQRTRSPSPRGATARAQNLVVSLSTRADRPRLRPSTLGTLGTSPSASKSEGRQAQGEGRLATGRRPGGKMSIERHYLRDAHSCRTSMPLRISTRCRRLRNDMPSSVVPSLPASITAPDTSRTMMSPTVMRSMVTGAMRA